jgi:hypothetical protein
MELFRQSSEKIHSFVEKNMRSLNEKHIQEHVLPSHLKPHLREVLVTTSRTSREFRAGLTKIGCLSEIGLKVGLPTKKSI